MRILICDDDPLYIEELKKYIQYYFSSCHLKLPDLVSFSNGKSLLEDQGEKDIVFLDIEMPGMNGIYVGRELKKENKHVIIFVVTAYSEYLDEAMRFHVFRYLSKPLDRQRFLRNMKDALAYYHSVSVKIPIETKDGVYTLPSSCIVAVEAQRRKVFVYTVRQTYQSVHNMDYWMEQLPENNFFRTHRSYIVNFEHVSDFDHTTVHLLNGQRTAYLTRRKYTSFKDAYLLYLENTR